MATVTLKTIEDLITERVGAYGMNPSGGVVTPGRFIDEGRILFERHKPRRRSVKINGSGAYYYLVSSSNLVGFDPEFSRVEEIEYPIDELPEPSMLDRNTFALREIEENGSGVRQFWLVLPEIVPAGTYFRAFYTTRHTLNDAASTVEDGPHLGLVYFACHAYALSMAQRLNRERANPTFAQDGGINLGVAERAAEARRAADDFLQDAYRVLGMETAVQGGGGGSSGGAVGSPAILSIGDADPTPGGRNGRWLTHGPLDR